MPRTKYSQKYVGLLRSIVRIINDSEVIKIAIEPNRRQILGLLNAQDMTVSELANILRKDISTVYRHVHKLEGSGLVEPAGEKKVHNVPEKVYRRTAKLFFFSPGAAKKIEDQILTGYTMSMSQTLLRVLAEMGYDIKRDPESDDKFSRMVLKLNDLSAGGMERIPHDEEREISLPMYVFLILAIGVINLESDPELKMACEHFLARVNNKKLLVG